MTICMILLVEYRVIFEVVYLKRLSGTFQWCRSKAKWLFQTDALIDRTLYYASLWSYIAFHCFTKELIINLLSAQHIRTCFGRTLCIKRAHIGMNKFPFISNPPPPPRKDNEPHRQNGSSWLTEQHYFTYLHVIVINSIATHLTLLIAMWVQQHFWSTRVIKQIY